jgi:Zn-dependent peptidase ImmA (M78 family)/transcriptional regulator with XRE-family HTH domain
MTDERTIGRRLRAARKQLGLSLEIAANRVGFNSYQTLADIEKGVRALKVAELSALATAYFKDITYFLQEDEPSESRLQLAWRKTAGADTSEIEPKVRSTVEDYRLLEQLTGDLRPLSATPWQEEGAGLTFTVLEEKSLSVIEALELGCRPAACLAQAMEEALGIRMIFLDLGVASALSAVEAEDITIVVNSRDVPWRRNFDLAHELFHIYSRAAYPFAQLPEYESNSKSAVEKKADAFAASLLMPRQEVLKEFDARVRNDRITWMDIIDLACDFKVSTVALLYRLKTLERLNQDAIERLQGSDTFKSLDRLARSEEPRKIDQYSSRFVFLGLKALSSGKISKGRFCQIFGISRGEFRGFIEARGYSEDSVYEGDIALTNP